jgi:hypothetical protein
MSSDVDILGETSDRQQGSRQIIHTSVTSKAVSQSFPRSSGKTQMLGVDVLGIKFWQVRQAGYDRSSIVSTPRRGEATSETEQVQCVLPRVTACEFGMMMGKISPQSVH